MRPTDSATTGMTPTFLPQLRTIDIADCVHPCGFRYGRGEFNPYENYVVGLARGEPLQALRDRFTDFLVHYRPRDLGEALGVRTSRPIPMWLLPWKSWLKLGQQGAWRDSPDDVVDLLSYFSGRGIRKKRIEEEFSWLERAWRAIRDHGYQPRQHTFVCVHELRGSEGSRFIVTDGNHRLSAMAALGLREVQVRQPALFCSRRARAQWWPLVLSRHVTMPDALALFDAYFDGNAVPIRAAAPADLLEDD